MLAVTLLLCLQAVRVSPPAKQPPLVPVKIHNDSNLPFDAGEMRQLYEEATATVALELNSKHPAQLRPAIDLYIGADADDTLYQDEPAISRIELQKWSPELFALGVIVISRDSAIDMSTARQLAHHAFVAAEARVSVKK